MGGSAAYPGAGGSTDTAIFGATVLSNVPTFDLSSNSIGELVFQSPSGGWTLSTTASSNILTLNAVGGLGIDATAQSSGTTDITPSIALGAAQTWAVGTGGTLELDGVLTGTSALTIGTSTATGTVIFGGLSPALTSSITIASGATLQLGTNSSGFDGMVAGPISLASATSVLTFDNLAAQTYSGSITGATGSTVNANGNGVLTLNASSTGFQGTANVAGSTLQLGDGTATGVGTFGSSSTIALQGAAILTFDEGVATTYAGTISGGGSNVISVSGPSAGVITTLTNLNPNYNGTVNVLGANGLQLGNNTSSATDGNFGGNSVVNLSNLTNLYINDAGNETLSFGISSNSAFINFNGSGSTTVASTINLIVSGTNSGNSYLIFSGGPVNLIGSVNASTDDNSQYFYDRTSSAITLSNASNPFDYAARFYFQAINGATSTLGENVTLASGAALSANNSMNVADESNNPSSPNSATTLPPPIVFNDYGSITTTTLYLNYIASSSTAGIGQATLNVVGNINQSASVTGNIYTGFNTATNNVATSTLNVGPYGAVKSTTGTKDQFSINAGSYSYVSVAGANATFSAIPASGNGIFYLGLGGDAFMEIGNGGTLNFSSGAVTGNDSTTSTTFYGFIMGEGATTGTSTESSYLNVYHGGLLTYNSNLNGDTNFIAGMTSGQTSVISVIGGEIKNQAVNSAIVLGLVAGTKSTLNIDSDSSGNIGLLISSYVKSTSANTSAYVNFNGGEYEFANNANPLAAQGSFVNTNVQGGVYIYSKGAIIGTNASGNTPQNVTIPDVIKAPTGNGVTSITLTSPGAGYTSPPLVKISSGGGADATGYATINSAGSITGVFITSPGFGYTSAPTISFIDGGTPASGTSYASNYTFTPASATAAISADATTGGLTKVDSGTLILSQANTYGGPTLITAGTVEFTGTSNSTNAVTALSTASNPTSLYTSSTAANNIASAATILVGDLPVGGSLPAGGSVSNAGTFTINKTATGGFVLSSAVDQTLAGFGTVSGTSTYGLTIGNQTVIAAGTGSGTAVQSLVATPNTYTTVGTPTATFNTGNLGNATGTATGALTITSGNTSSPMTTTFAAGGTYYWKLNESAGGTAATSIAGQAQVSDVSGTNWDGLVLDTLSVTATPVGAFTIQAVGFTGGTASNPVTIGTGNSTYYSWTIARIGTGTGTAPNLSGILADLSLNTSAMPTPAVGYSYYLTTQVDPSISSDTDLVANYGPTIAVPEPTAIGLLLAPTAGLLIRRRRRRA